MRLYPAQMPEQEENEMFTIPAIDMAKTGQNIIFLRKKAGLTVKDLQDAFGFGTPQAIYKWQQGLALPTIDNLVVLAALLGVKIDDILVTDAPEQMQISRQMPEFKIAIYKGYIVIFSSEMIPIHGR